MKTIQKILLEKQGTFSGTAIQSGDKSLSFHDFDCRTEKFASGLARLGVGPGNLVVLNMKRNIDLVIAMFGILKTGAAFAPVVSGTPKKRLQSIMNSFDNSVLMDESFYQKIMDESQEESLPFIPLMASEDDPAVVLYTSGSTGEPKGVVQSQHSLALLFVQFPHNLGSAGISIPEFDTVFARVNHAYVVSYHFEYPVALLNGKKLVLFSEEEQNSIMCTCEYLENNRQVCMAILPSQLSIYLENERFCKALSSVSCLCFFAEPVSEALRNKLRSIESFKGFLVTVYGQTEGFGIGWQDISSNKKMVPSPGTQSSVIDENGAVLPKGEKGELVVHTPSLFTKYLLEDAANANALFESKKIEINGLRYLRTGDLACISEDGSFQLFGRNDRMVKYHGQRIELAEIETIMKEYNGIRNSCVLVRKDKNDHDVLTAFYEGEQNRDVDINLLRANMSEMLPPFMIPVIFIRLDALPCNNNGKIDYIALKNMPLKLEEVHDCRKLSPEEKIIVKYAAQLLKLEESEIYADSNLMTLGMDSLNAVILINKLAEEGYVLSVDDIIASVSVDEIAGKLKKRERRKAEKKEVSALVQSTDMQSDWARGHMQIVANIICFRGIDKQEFQYKVDRMSAVHPSLRSAFIEIDGKIYTKVLKSRPIRHDYFDIRHLGDGSEEITKNQRDLIVYKMNELFMHPDLADLLYPMAFRTHDDKTVFVIRFDHRVVDGMGQKILLQEFLTEDKLEDCDNYIEYLEYTADAEVREKAAAFWKDYLKGTSLACIPKNSFSAGKPKYKKYKYSMTGTREERIRALCREENISVSAFVLCQYARAIMDVLGKDDMVIPMGVSGRSASVEGMDRIMGCLVNEVPIRMKRDYTENDFMKSYLQADRYSFLPKEILFQQCFGIAGEPQIAPYVVSEIFPENLIKEPFEFYETLSFHDYDRGEFLWEDSQGIHLMLNPDIDLWDEKMMDQVFQKTIELIERNTDIK